MARWVAMEEQIASYIAPDLSGFQTQLSDFDTTVNVTNEKIENLEAKLETEIINMNTILQSEISTAMELVTSAQGDARDIRNELRKDLGEIQDNIVQVDKRSRNSEQETRGSIRQSETEIRELIQHAEDRFDNKRTAIESDFTRRMENVDVKLKELEERLRQMLERALNNPLSGG